MCGSISSAVVSLRPLPSIEKIFAPAMFPHSPLQVTVRIEQRNAVQQGGGFVVYTL